MAEDRVQRRLAAILAADIVGYSRLMEADEEGTRRRLRAGEYRFCVYHPSGEHPLLPGPIRTLEEGAGFDLGTLRMREGGRLRIRVHAPDGMRFVGSTIDAWWGMILQGWREDESGARVTPLLSAGTVKLIASGTLDGERVFGKVEAEVLAGATTDVTIDLR